MLEYYARARRIRKKVRPKHSDLARRACEARAGLRQRANQEFALSTRLFHIWPTVLYTFTSRLFKND